MKKRFKDQYDKSNEDSKQLADLMAYRLLMDENFKCLNLCHKKVLEAVKEIKEAFQTFLGYVRDRVDLDKDSKKVELLRKAHKVFK